MSGPCPEDLPAEDRGGHAKTEEFIPQLQGPVMPHIKNTISFLLRETIQDAHRTHLRLPILEGMSEHIVFGASQLPSNFMKNRSFAAVLEDTIPFLYPTISRCPEILQSLLYSGPIFDAGGIS